MATVDTLSICAVVAFVAMLALVLTTYIALCSRLLQVKRNIETIERRSENMRHGVYAQAATERVPPAIVQGPCQTRWMSARAAALVFLGWWSSSMRPIFSSTPRMCSYLGVWCQSNYSTYGAVVNVPHSRPAHG